MMLLGLIWAAFAPLLFLPPIAALAWALKRSPRSALHRFRWAVATAVVLAPVALIWWADRAEFSALCDAQATVKIVRHDRVKGFYLNDPTANSFGMRYLQDEKFDWIEAKDYRHLEGFVRYERDGVNIKTVEIPELTARYEVRSTFSQPKPSASMTITQVIERTTGVQMAQSGLGHFNGGRAYALLGAWGSASCPDPGSKPWSDAYHLAKITLQ